MTNFERKPFDKSPYWDFFQGCGCEGTMDDFEDR